MKVAREARAAQEVPETQGSQVIAGLAFSIYTHYAHKCTTSVLHISDSAKHGSRWRPDIRVIKCCRWHGQHWRHWHHRQLRSVHGSLMIKLKALFVWHLRK